MADGLLIQDFEVFKGAMLEDNLTLQIDIVKRLQMLAKALGERATREELLPFIEQNIELHDEILFNLSEQLEHFMPLVGGYQHAGVLFDILAKLCATDELLVRERAVETLKIFAAELSDDLLEELLFPVVRRLFNEEWFTSKCSALMLFSTCYPRLGDQKKEELRNRFRTLIQDDSSLVRRAAAFACVDFFHCLEIDYVREEFIPILCDIAQDPLDTVRSITIDVALSLTDKLSEVEMNESVFKIIEQASDDPSWKSRYRLAINIAEIQRKIYYSKYRDRLISVFQKLSQDIEAAVRTVAASSVFNFSQSLRDSYIKQPQFDTTFEIVFEKSVMPVIRRLFTDDADDVRLMLSSNILSLGTILTECCFKKNMIPVLLEALEKEQSMVVQANYLQGLSNISRDVDLKESLDTIKAAIRSVLVKSQTNWRSRRSVLMTFVDLAKFCNSDYFSANFKLYYATLLGDSVCAVRRCACLILPLLAKQYGIKWVAENLIPYYAMFTRDARYLYRYVPLFGISELLNPTLSKENVSYLGGFEKLIEGNGRPSNRLAVVALAKIDKYCHEIDKQLEQDVYKDMLFLRTEVEYSDNDSVPIYFEKSLEEIREKYKDIHTYSIEEIDFDQSRWTYIQGILYLIHQNFLEIVKTLNGDVTENIQIRAIFTLGQIYDFITCLKKELSESWVQQALGQLSEEQLKRIDSEILKKMSIDHEDMDIIDTSLMDHVALPTSILKELPIIDEDVTNQSKITKNQIEVILEKKCPETSLDNMSECDELMENVDKDILN
ncbi:serine/threonine-protein phosphatase 2A 65 kDa regulatory subunit A beta isoform-like [Cylas formicarius]|uniref:serine/threonine-protein phosphatase 2A 65 kDa regulatory subunit A beta isoform-like n=1 Tax=Cylas formicarius TaxID=197179 RepID=UPI00295884A0|nr:serine/threonine-protein phosphatase 2A 65 kDa regulatory subunit A beta isoform-like [Cylas formicarius]